MNIDKIFDLHYKKLILIPLIILVISLLLILSNVSKTGEIVDRDVSLKGGISLTLQKDNLDPIEMENFLKQKFTDISVRGLADFTTQKNIGLIIEVSDITSDELKQAIREKIPFKENEISIEETGASLGESFFKDLLTALIIAFVLMAIIIFITFRTLVPSVAVILAAVTDIVVTLAIINLLGVRISSAGIVAFLLILGYSIDTDILLTTRMIKRRQGTLIERMKGAMKTGLTMTSTTIVALTLAFFATNSPVLKQMFMIIVIALIVDIIVTYLANAPILIWHARRKGL